VSACSGSGSKALAGRSSRSSSRPSTAPLGSEPGVDLPQELALSPVGDERALEALHEDDLEVLEREAELLVGDEQLIGHGGVGDQPVVSVQRHADAEVIEQPQRVMPQVADDAGLQVARQADLKRHPVVGDVGEQVTVLGEPGAVADAVGAAEVERLGDRLGAVGLAGVDGRGHVVGEDEREAAGVVLGGVARLTAGEIEGHHPPRLVGDRQLGEPKALRRVDVADAAYDDTCGNVEITLGLAQAAQHRVDDAGEREPLARVQDGGVAHLEVPDVLPGSVLGELVGGALEGGLGLEDRAGDVEGLEVVDEAVADLAHVDRPREALLVGGVKGDPVLGGELEDGAQSKAAVEVTVEIGLGERLEERPGDRLGRDGVAVAAGGRLAFIVWAIAHGRGPLSRRVPTRPRRRSQRRPEHSSRCHPAGGYRLPRRKHEMRPV
jgi:hypothetical protein